MALSDHVLATCQRWQMFPPGSSVLVAVSGGPDSVALLAVLHELSPRLRIRIGIGHLDHGIRSPAVAAADSALVRRLAQRFDLRCHCASVDVPARAAAQGLSLEHAAREARYAFLRDVAAREGYAMIATGHTLNDQAETVLLAMIRGAGTAGYGGIRPVTGDLVRPLLESTRADVLSYLAAAGLTYCTDETNADLSFPRNRVRHRLLPLLEAEFNPGIQATLARSARVVQDDDQLLASLAADLYARSASRPSPDVVALARGELANAPTALVRRAFRLAAAALLAGSAMEGGVQPRPLAAANVDDLADLLAEGPTGGVIDLPGGHWAELQPDRILFCRGPRPDRDQAVANGPAWSLSVPGDLVVPALGWSLNAACKHRSELGEQAECAWRVNQSPGQTAFTAYLAMDSLKLPLTVRQRRAGDRFRPQGAPGRRKLQDVLVDGKVPRRVRDRVPVVCDAMGQVIALLPLRVDETVVVTPQTALVLVLSGSIATW